MDTAPDNLPYADLASAALSLDATQRGALASQLLRSLDDDLPPGQDKTPDEWHAAVQDRIDSALNGQGQSVGFPEAIEAIRQAGRGE